MYPLLGPLFNGCLLKAQASPLLEQCEHGAVPVSSSASHRIFLRRHSSQARDTLDLGAFSRADVEGPRSGLPLV
jgi:hypothetical protein